MRKWNWKPDSLIHDLKNNLSFMGKFSNEKFSWK